jgi:radical SAM protein with 4Fe4S-binding SPASM domain
VAVALDQLFEMGVYYVTFSGGEPFCRSDLFDVLSHARERGLFFGIMTNGTLITESIADRIKELGTLGVDVSLYGASAVTHERVTGVPGSFDKAVRAIELLRERKLRVGVKTTLMKCNCGEHRLIESIARGLGASYRPDPILFPKVGHPGSAAAFRMDDEQLRAIVSQRNWIPDDADVVMCSMESHLTCGAGRTRCAVSPQGDVFPCTLWRASLGKLSERSFSEIWRGASAEWIRSISYGALESCARCELVGYCARCPGLIYMEDGDILGPSSENCRLAGATEGVKHGTD